MRALPGRIKKKRGENRSAVFPFLPLYGELYLK
jgi:hypothetical protein